MSSAWKAAIRYSMHAITEVKLTVWARIPTSNCLFGNCSRGKGLSTHCARVGHIARRALDQARVHAGLNCLASSTTQPRIEEPLAHSQAALKCFDDRHSGPPSAATGVVCPVWSHAAWRRDEKRLLARRAVLPVQPAHPSERSRRWPRPRFPRTAPTLSCVLSQSIPRRRVAYWPGMVYLRPPRRNGSMGPSQTRTLGFHRRLNAFCKLGAGKPSAGRV